MSNRITQFRVGYTLLALNFALPAVSYIVAPELALASVQRLNTALGGGALDTAGAPLWHMLAVGNVATLALLCALLLVDLARFYPALPALAFLKSFSALYSLGLFLSGGPPFFAAVFVLDAVTTLLLVVLPVRAIADARGQAARLPPKDLSAPWWARALLLRPRQIERTLAVLQKSGLVERAPNLWQVFLGTCAMAHRVLFRSETIGTSRQPVRTSLRARLLSLRAVRLPVLLWERVIKPLELLGLSADEDMIVRHLLGAHHDGDQFTYDLQFLSIYEGGLARLERECASIVDGTHPRAELLRDLVVFEGYHESLLAAVRAFLAQGDAAVSDAVRADPDLSLSGTLMWCARMPASFAQTRAQWGSLKVRFV